MFSQIFAYPKVAYFLMFSSRSFIDLYFVLRYKLNLKFLYMVCVRSSFFSYVRQAFPAPFDENVYPLNCIDIWSKVNCSVYIFSVLNSIFLMPIPHCLVADVLRESRLCSLFVFVFVECLLYSNSSVTGRTF